MFNPVLIFIVVVFANATNLAKQNLQLRKVNLALKHALQELSLAQSEVAVGESMTIVQGGSINHGKSTLAAALSAFSGDGKSLAEINNAPTTSSYGANFAYSTVEFNTAERNYQIVDFPTHRDFILGMITNTPQMDAILLVADGVASLEADDNNEVMMATNMGMQGVCFINKCEVADEDDVFLMEYDIMEYGMPIVRGSALGALNGEPEWTAKIVELGHTLDEHFNVPQPAPKVPSISFDAYFYMLLPEEGGRSTPLSHQNHDTYFYFGTTDIKGQIKSAMDENDGSYLELFQPGAFQQITVQLSTPVNMNTGTVFELRESGVTKGVGRVYHNQ